MKNNQILAAIAAVLICLLFSVGVLSNNTALRYVLNTQTDTADAKLNTNHRYAGAASTNFHQTLAENYKTQQNGSGTSEGYTVGGIPAEGYPEYYAGSYLNENGELVFLVTEEYAKSRKQEQAEIDAKTLTQSDELVFHTAKYSYRELINVMTEISTFRRSELKEKAPFKIWMSGINDYKNCVIVYISSVDKKALKWFRMYVSSAECIQFVQQDTSGIEAGTEPLPNNPSTTAPK